ncbi:MAG: aspartate aminotransferase family protein [Paraburkholderia tropica]|uniref:Putrescine aminotransferase n=1 Tax=Paraburkholderia tropica TaxID=92647 RepID=A0AAQ1JS13_9BURK|nr:aspartate aminotransferase family protein [Paraburkholderia tropica]MDE1139407.1 aspartate aminotransferase family protein [Paraburkholderia tropica]PXX19856.1 putrescine aminotransferase [Paraburkholderia tropica]PZW88797.1 putrescine aminotransferase [Paraburkholderia tropica]QNB13959.1 aspartate aminotransferase family protein [Paraburkholderia tropica]RQN39991.1 aspartate aminotransferase family protein [Paraburkholderia tropica]
MSYRIDAPASALQEAPTTLRAQAAQGARTTAEYRALDAAHHIHPFSDMGSLNKAGSRVIVKAKGVYLWDSDGNQIIDGMAGLWCVNVGYGRKELADAAYEQMLQLPFYNTFFKTTHPPVIELSALLAEVSPEPFNHFFYCNSGSEGNDTVLRIVHQYWLTQGKPSKKVVISRRNAYHGSTIAGGTLGGMGYMHEQMPSKVENIVHIDQPYFYGEAEGNMTPEEFGLARAQQLEAKILEVGAENVAAFIGEPFQGAGGVIFPASTYWPEIQRICRKYDILLCADEVIGGFGRTGEWFAHQHFGFEPDLITMAKGLTSGYVPMGAVGLHDRVAKALIENGDFNHGLTYSGHPVAAAVAVANLKLLRDEKIVERVKTDTGPYFQQQLRETFANHPIVGDISGAGLVAGLQLAEDPKTRKRFANGGDVGTICRDFCFNGNLIMRATGDRMLLSPPLVITRGEIDEIVSKAKKAVDATAQQLGFS